MSDTIKIIDVHSHFILPCYLDGLKQMHINPAQEDGFPTPPWSVEGHLAFMEEAGIDHSILSLSTPHIHHGDDALAIALCRQINEETSAICHAHPDKFSFAACLPTPSVDGSLAEIAYAYDHLGAVGVKVASNNNGVYLGDPSLDPIFEELNRRKAVITIHPSRAQATPNNVFTSGPAPLFEYIADTTRAVLNIITNGTLEKYPDIKVIVPHSGSFLPFVIHRLIGISEVLIPKGLMEPVDVLGCFNRLYFDIAGDALPIALDALLKVADPSHIMYGADYPYTPSVPIIRKQKQLLEYPPLQPIKEEVFYKNAAKLYGISL